MLYTLGALPTVADAIGEVGSAKVNSVVEEEVSISAEVHSRSGDVVLRTEEPLRVMRLVSVARELGRDANESGSVKKSTQFRVPKKTEASNVVEEVSPRTVFGGVAGTKGELRLEGVLLQYVDGSDEAHVATPRGKSLALLGTSVRLSIRSTERAP